MFRGVAFEGFPPFRDGVIRLTPVEDKPAELAEVHLFTGVNGTGKTRLLCALAAMLGHADPLRKRLKGAEKPSTLRATDQDPPRDRVGEWRGHWIAASGQVQPQAAGGITGWALQIPAFAYCGTAYVSDVQIRVIAGLPKPDRPFCLSFSRPETQSQELLQAIANLKVQAAIDLMNRSGDEDAPSHPTRIVRALEGTLGQITGRSFLFQVTSRPTAMLEVVWGDTKLSFDLLPDGLRSVIGWLVHAVVMMDAWLAGKADPTRSEAVFLLDEIESHLHPAWQRRVLPAFQRLFPKAQIFVATHSPFVIASLNHGWIHRLTLEDGFVTVQEPIAASQGDSYITVVEDIMGLKEWYDPETESLLRDFRSQRDAAYHGSIEAQTAARRLAEQIGQRSMELAYVMGRELSQMDRQLAASPASR